MLNTDDAKLLSFISDYKLQLIAPNEITDFYRFKMTLGIVLETIKYSSDEAAMDNLIDSTPAFENLDINVIPKGFRGSTPNIMVLCDDRKRK